MVSMTDFMQQKMIQESAVPTEPEKTEEELSAAVLESYLSMSAAIARVECLCEYAKITAFCESAEVVTPEMVTVQMESFADTMKNVFETIGEWFRSIIASFIGMFTTSKLQKLIAKLKQDPSITIKPDDEVALGLFGIETMFDMLENFRTVLTEKELPLDEAVRYREKAEALIAKDAWHNGLLKLDKVPNNEISASVLIETLETINKFDIPKKGNALLKSMKFDEKAYKKVDEEGNETDKVDTERVTEIKKTARCIAKAYDMMVRGLVKVADKTFGKNPTKDEEQYKQDLEDAKKAHKDKVAYNKDEDSANRPSTVSEAYFEN